MPESSDMQLPSTKPYLLRAIWEWCCDHGFTPYIAVEVDERARVPREHVKNGQIVLNIDQGATNRLKIGNELIEFQARFGGVARELSVPVGQVVAIYARENGAGMAFEVDAPVQGGKPAKSKAISKPTETLPDAVPDKPPSGRPGLKLVK